MATYIGFLRAINLGANRKFPKDAIRDAVAGAGFTDVETYINTGNVRFGSTMRSRSKVEATLEAAFLADRGFEVPTIVLTPEQLVAVAADAAELGAARADLERHYIYLLKAEPDPDRVDTLLARARDDVVVRNRAAHLLHGPGYRAGTVDPYGVEKALGVVATNRNRTVIQALAEKWG